MVWRAVLASGSVAKGVGPCSHIGKVRAAGIAEYVLRPSFGG